MKPAITDQLFVKDILHPTCAFDIMSSYPNLDSLICPFSSSALLFSHKYMLPHMIYLVCKNLILCVTSHDLFGMQKPDFMQTLCHVNN